MVFGAAVVAGAVVVVGADVVVGALVEVETVDSCTSGCCSFSCC